MCEINSGKFGVQWERTEGVLEGISLEEGRSVEIEIWNR
jgi:ADP-ribose 1''-phosphate phosphatase